MKRKLLILFPLVIASILCSCSTGSISPHGAYKVIDDIANSAGDYFSLSMGTNSQSLEELKLNTNTKILQNKLKLKNNRLVYSKDSNTKCYEDMSLYFSGSNISQISIHSKNETMIYDNPDKPVSGIDYIDMYTAVDDSILDENNIAHTAFNPLDKTQFDEPKYLELLWNSGKFDDVKYTFCNGCDLFDVTRVTKNHSGASLDWESNFCIDEYTGELVSNAGSKGFTLDNNRYYMNKLHKVKGWFISYRLTYSTYYDKNVMTPNDVAVYGRDIVFRPRFENRVVWKYEGLFYDYLKTNKTINYKSITDKVKITVSYFDTAIEQYTLKFSFDKNGDIIAKLNKN